MSEMPAAPEGMVWVLEFNPLYNDATLWLYKKSRLTGGSNGNCVKCEGLQAPDYPMRARLNPETASLEEIVEATVVSANKLVREVDAAPARKVEQEAKAAELSKRLGIKVEVRR